MATEPLTTRALISAHRHGNDLTLLRQAEAAGADLVELDVHLYRRRLEARHSKTIGPLPIFWDRNERPRWNAPRLTLDQVLDEAAPHTALHVDLKGFRRRAARLTAQALADRQVVVSSRTWWMLKPFRTHRRAALLHSIGARWQLRLFETLRPRIAQQGVAIRRDLLNRELVERWKACGLIVYVWRVPDARDAGELIEWGVDGLIVDSLSLVVEPLRAPPDRSMPRAGSQPQ